MASTSRHVQLPSGFNTKHDVSKLSLSDKYDRSILSMIDPDLNYLNISKNNITSEYYDESSFNTRFTDNNCLSLIHLNIRSLPLHFREFLAYLNTLQMDFKIIAFSETAINSNHITYNIPNYNMEMDFRYKKRGGGTSIYIHCSLQYKRRRDLQLGGDTNSVFIEILRNSTNAKCNIICGCVYRPPFMSLKCFNELLANTLTVLQTEKKYIFITGDFNVNLLPHSIREKHSQDFKNLFSQNFFTPLITKPTRVTPHSSTLIDNIFSNMPSVADVCKPGILRTSISDHYSIFCIMKNVPLINDKKKITKRSFCDKHIAAFQRRLACQSWDFVYESENTQLAFTRFQQVINQHFDKNFKMHTITVNYKTRHPWMTKSLRSRILEKNAMHARALESSDETIFKDYNKTKNILKSSLRNAEIQYFSNQFDLHKHDISRSWKILKTIIGKNAKSAQNSTFYIDGHHVSNSKDIANGFNDFFCFYWPSACRGYSLYC